jgi:hypothetical protein
VGSGLDGAMNGFLDRGIELVDVAKRGLSCTTFRGEVGGVVGDQPTYLSLNTLSNYSL